MEKKKLSKVITLVIPDNLFNQSMLILKKYFDYETLDPSTFEVESVRSIRKVGYTTEQAIPTIISRGEEDNLVSCPKRQGIWSI